MKINNKFLSIPPYVSVSWSEVVALHTEDGALVIPLRTGKKIQITGLSSELIETIFSAHAQYMAGGAEPTPQKEANKKPSVRFGFGDAIPAELGSAMQHRMENANAPDLPQELLDKISSVAKIMAPEGSEFPEAEPHCNCPHCQIARAISGKVAEKLEMNDIESTIIDEEITDEDLKFEQWMVTDLGDHRYAVTNKLDKSEQYMVYLGEESVGCNCGREGCDHVIAVLNS
ncbi:MAG: hypothetical protein H7A37_02565 [Chlamydiales bacterium]|nr:hypothetical protein [Chlamydiia bacterium]MCP5507172.1 hypothetical protein [Chlamydiales bacterium]